MVVYRSVAAVFFPTVAITALAVRVQRFGVPVGRARALLQRACDALPALPDTTQWHVLKA